ncbi:class I SAM-dependent methyltransferase [Streptomyces chrestomyceticus]|uniref:class I SAM-dependent methyltransferase n=1 Tax=Streptomyces chrestomyceticus TaxID=68185 RepID=UPI0019D0E722|nr:class I SAM-dependent methyltransferase [Streptomyces chrestomyceticus]
MSAEPSWTGAFSHQEIERTYAMLTALEEDAAGPDRHFGLWHGADDPASVEEATGRLTERVLSQLGAERGSRILDVGCGNGRPAVRLAQTSGASVVGIDIDERALRAASAYAQQLGLGHAVRFQHADALRPPFEDASFDAALAFESTPHFDVAELYGALARVLRPGGRLVVETPYVRGRTTRELLDRIGPYLSLLNAVSLDPPHVHLAAARQAGLHITELSDLTESVRGSFGRLLARLEKAGTRLADTLGDEQAGRLLAAFAGWAEAPEVGGILMTFTRTEH